MSRARSPRSSPSPRRRGLRALVGDVGGTHARLGLFDLGTSPKTAATKVAQIDVESRTHESLESIALPFVREHGQGVDVAVLGVAGPVREGVATITNLPWKLEERALERAIGAGKLVLVNDLVAAARGCLDLDAAALTTLTPNLPSPLGKHLAVIAAGTGLGEARLLWDGEKHLALPSEGGHCDFAPRTPLEMELLHFLAARHGEHVSFERVVSGAGLGALYDFFSSRAGREPRAIEKRLAEGDRNATIAELGLARASRPATRAVDLFASIYGAEAGNLALRELATGGVFVVGNIGRHIVPARRDAFVERFIRKGRFATLLSAIPIAVVNDAEVGLHGALALAEALARA